MIVKALLAAPEMTARRALPALRVGWGDRQLYQAAGGGGGAYLGGDALPTEASSPLLSSMASATRFASSRLGSLDSNSGTNTTNAANICRSRFIKCINP